jgi:hypothetical protein
VGPITQGPCSVTQVGGAGNSATDGNCIVNPPISPPVLSQVQIDALRSWSEDHLEHPVNIVAPFSPVPPAVRIFGKQLEDGFRKTGGSYGSIVGIHGGCYDKDGLTSWICLAAGKNRLADVESLSRVIVASGIQAPPITYCTDQNNDTLFILLVRPY